jgi:hypothetical protein
MTEATKEVAQAMNEPEKAEGVGEGSAPPPAMQEPQEARHPETIPDAARQHLKPGRHTRFANGQVWTVGKDGQPEKVA